MANRKRKSIQDQHAELYWRQYSWAPKLQERYPGLLSVQIDLTFKDFDSWSSNPKPCTLSFGPDQKAFFHEKCPYHECVRGGFDFSQGVSDAVNSADSKAEGRVVCSGWQDQERINRHRCMLSASYSITVCKS